MDFQNKIEKVDTFSIAFYYYRGDFARWIRDVIGLRFNLGAECERKKHPEVRGFEKQYFAEFENAYC